MALADIPETETAFEDLERRHKEVMRIFEIIVKKEGSITINDRDLMASTDDGHVEVDIDGNRPYERTYRWVSNRQKTRIL
jgi:hypothetical protein